MKALAVIGLLMLIFYVVAITILRITTGLIHIMLVVGLILLVVGFIRRGVSSVRS